LFLAPSLLYLLRHQPSGIGSTRKANEEQLAILCQGVGWNKWRERSRAEVNLAEAKKGATVAVKVTDLLGEEVLVVKQV